LPARRVVVAGRPPHKRALASGTAVSIWDHERGDDRMMRGFAPAVTAWENAAVCAAWSIESASTAGHEDPHVGRYAPWRFTVLSLKP